MRLQITPPPPPTHTHTPHAPFIVWLNVEKIRTETAYTMAAGVDNSVVLSSGFLPRPITLFYCDVTPFQSNARPVVSVSHDVLRHSQINLLEAATRHSNRIRGVHVMAALGWSLDKGTIR